MGDSAEVFQALKEIRRQQKAETRAQAVALIERLEAAGKVRVERFTPDHWRVSRNGRAVDLWPSTERWRPVGSTKRGRHGLVTAMGFLAGRDHV